VESDGTVTALAAGSATITATLEDAEATIQVTVQAEAVPTENVLHSITLSPDTLDMGAGERTVRGTFDVEITAPILDDADAGFSLIHRAADGSTSESVPCNAHGIAGRVSAYRATFECSARMDDHAGGEWRIMSQLSIASGESFVINLTDEQRLSVYLDNPAADTEAPRLVGLEIVGDPFDPYGEGEDLVFHVAFTDDISGAARVNIETEILDATNSNPRPATCDIPSDRFEDQLVSGTVNDGVVECRHLASDYTAKHPIQNTFGARGTLRITRVTLTDAAENRSEVFGAALNAIASEEERTFVVK
jgi:hypothetical protein